MNAMLIDKTKDAIFLRARVHEYYRKKLTDVTGNSEASVEQKAQLHSAIDCLTSITNVFAGLAGAVSLGSVSLGAYASSINDLTFGLESNDFWLGRKAYLQPIFLSCVDSFVASLRDDLPETIVFQRQWLSLIPAVLFCLGGYSLRNGHSSEMITEVSRLVYG